MDQTKLLKSFYTLLILCLSGFYTLSVANCVNFDLLEEGVNYGDEPAGTILTTENDIEVTMVGWYGPGSTSPLLGYIDAIVDPLCGPFPSADGLHVFMANGLNFNFDGFGATSVVFDFHTCAPEGAFAINGGNLIDFYYQNSPDTTFNLSSGHVVNILRNPSIDGEGQVIISGIIEDLTIQGVELALDNICYGTDPLTCEISNLNITPQDCNPDGTYDLLIQFNYLNPGNDLFDVYNNLNEIIGTFALDDLPVTLENYIPSGNDTEAILVCINDSQGCCEGLIFEGPECDLPCELSNLAIVPTACDGDFFSVIIDFDHANTSTSFSVTGNGNDYGDFSYDDLPIMITGLEGDGTSGYEFLITDNTDPNCSLFDQIQAVDCNPTCEIVSASVDLVCLNNNGGSAFQTTINLEANNAAGLDFSIDFGGDPAFYTYAYEDFPITLNLALSVTEITVTAVNDENCSVTVDLDFPDCVCGATNYTHNFLACTDEGWELEIDFDYSGADENFEVRDNDDNLLGTFNTSQLPITLEAPLNANGAPFVRLHFCFLETMCCTYEDFSGPFCDGACHLFNENITSSDCNDHGNITLTFDFDYENTSDSFYIIFYGTPNLNFGPFAYTDLPVDIPNLEADGELFIIDIVDNEPNPSSNCRLGIDYQDVPNCFGPDECMINEVIAEVSCDGAGSYHLLIDLDIENAPDNEFNVFVTGLGNIGPISINDFPLNINDYNHNGSFHYVSITDVNDPGCSGISYFELPQCEFCISFDNLEDGVDYGSLESGDTLTVENDVVVTIGDFNSYIYAQVDPFCGPFPAANGIHTFIFSDLLFDFSNLPHPSATVSFDFHTCDPGGTLSVNGGNEFDFFYFNSLDTTFTLNSGHIVQIIRNPDVNWEGQVNISGDVDNISIEGVELAIDNICYTLAPPPCEISNLIAEAYDCDDNGQFLIDIDFDFAHTSDSFNLLIDGISQGIFAYADLFVTVGPFDGNGQPMQIEVIDQDDSGCTGFFLLEAPDCAIPCVINTTALNQDCDDEGLFYTTFVVVNDNPNDLGYQVLVDGVFYGEYSYDITSVDIGPLEANGQTIVLTAVDILDPNCTSIFTIQAPNCDPVFCQISNFVSTDPVCNPNGGYDLTLDFVYQNPDNDFFDLFNADDELIGTYALADLPLTLENYEPFYNDSEVFYACINDNPNCCLSLTLLFPECTEPCFINTTAINQDCDDEGLFYTTFVVVNDNPNDLGYQVLVDGVFYGEYSYDITSVDIGPLEANGQTIVLTAVDILDPNCTSLFTIQAPNCDPVFCQITGLETSIPECNPNGGYDLVLGFQVENPDNDFFDLFDNNGALIGTYPLAELPITLENYTPTEIDFEVFQVCINDNPNCCQILTVTFPECTEPCFINTTALNQDCDDEGFFYTTFVVVNDNPNDLGYQVLVDGVFYGEYSYDITSVDIGPLEANGQTIVLTAVDILDPNCTSLFTIQAPNCDPVFCQITGLETSIPECNPNGGYDLVLGFQVENPDNDFFDLFDNNGELIGTYTLAELPITLENYTPTEIDFEVFQVCINDNPNCCQILTVTFPECTEDCAISDLIVEAYDCDPNGSFLIDLDFNYTGTSDSFSLVGNGTNYGNFAYADLFITLGPFQGNGQTLEFIVADLDNPNCATEGILIAPNCNPPICQITGLETSTPECNPNGAYDLVLGFQVENPDNDFFDLFDNNGELIGTYALAELPITLENYTPTGIDFEVFQVCINDNPNCCQILTVTFPECTEDCAISDLIIEAYDCDPNGSFLIDLDFNYTGTSDSFSLVGNGTNYGNFAYADLFITLGPFQGNGQTLEFIVADLDNPNCATEGILIAPNCNSNCEIWDLVAEAQDCNDDGTFDIILDFNYANANNDFFDVFNQLNELVGTYPLDNLPITIENYQAISNDDTESFVVCINDSAGCCNDFLLEIPDCNNEDCTISDLIVEAYDCDPNGSFLIDLDFNYIGTSDSFSLVGNGTNYGNFAYADLFITLGPFQGNGQTLEFIVADLDNPNCASEAILIAPNCNSNCEIWDLVAEAQDCNDNGTFDIILDFNYANANNDFFDVFNQLNELVGTYPLDNLPITIENYQAISNDDTESFVICINDSAGCCNDFLLEIPDCSNEDCAISNLEFAPFCDNGMLYTEIIFDYNGNGSDSFQILSCAPIGTFAYNSSGVYTIEVPEDLVNCAGGVFIPIGIFDLDNNACGDTEFLFIPDCYDTGCQIEEINADVSDCDDDTFTVTLDFDFQDVGDDGFQVTGNGNNYGDFAYNELPITLGPFAGTGQDFEFIVTDNDDDDCWNFVEITAPDCVPPVSSCIDFEGLTDGINYGGSNSQIGDLLLIENDVLVTMEGVPDPLGTVNYDYLFATTQDICTPFDAASDNRIFMFNGLRFDFSPLPQNPTIVTFPYHNCGIPFAISVNDQVPVTYLFPQSDTTFNLSPGVVIDIQLDANSTEEGTITLQGFISSFFIGGVELQIDNVCFNVETSEPDVWPGDANYDNVANHFDLLNVGIAFGIEGINRDNISTDWFAMEAEDWNQYFADGETNYKHADCDGNGIVEMADTFAILDNYDLDHGPTPIFIPLTGTPADPPFFVDLPDAQDMMLNTLFEAPIVLGTPSIPVDNIYGLAFTVNFDVDMMDENQVSIELGDSWMGMDGQNLIHLNKKFANEGAFEVAITRTNQENTNGSGAIGHFIGIIDDILGRTEVEVTITNVKAIQFDESLVPLYLPVETVDIATDTPLGPEKGEILIYPNPTIEVIHIDNQTDENVRKVKVFNALGQLMTIITNPQPYETIHVSDWAAGVYFVKLELESRILTKRVKKTTK